MKRLGILLLIALFGGSALAHDHQSHIMGTITAVNNETVTIKSVHGALQVVTITPETTLLKGETAAQPTDLRVGQRAVVHAKPSGEKLEATEIKIGVSQAATDPKLHAQHEHVASAKANDRQVQTWDAKSIVWQSTGSDGTKWAVLEGDQNAVGKEFTYAAFIPAGYWDQHAHSSDARVTVVLGAIKVAQGPKLDKDTAAAYGVGSYLFVPGNVEHAMGADVDTIIIGTTTGPWETHHHGEHSHQH